MNREIVAKIYESSVAGAVETSKDKDEEFSTAWSWEENMVKNTILELKYALSVNRAALTLDQLTIINNIFGTEL